MAGFTGLPIPSRWPLSYISEETELPNSLGFVVIQPPRASTYYLPKLLENMMPGAVMVIKNNSPYLILILAREGDYIDRDVSYMMQSDMVLTLVVGATGTQTWLISNQVVTNSQTMSLFMLLEVLDINQTPTGAPFLFSSDVSNVGYTASMAIPSISFQVPPEGGTLIAIYGLLPPALRPFYPIYPSFNMVGDVNSDDCSLTVGSDGAIRFTAQDGGVITGNIKNLHAFTVNYTTPTRYVPPPINLPLGLGTSRVNQPDSPDLAYQFREWNRLDFVNNQLIWCYSDNSATKTTPPYNLNLVTQSGSLDPAGVLTLDSPVVVMEVPLGVFCAENSITINPTDTTKRFFTTHLNDYRNGPLVAQAWCGVSVDSGQTWNVRQLDLPPMDIMDHDWNAAFDPFGRLWLITLIKTNTEGVCNLAIYYSDDGGLSFTLGYQTTDASELMTYDFPQMTFGGDGGTGHCLWFSANQGNLETRIPFYPCLGYIPISGIGVANFGAVRLVKLTEYDFTLNGGIASASIVASATGKVFLYGFSGVGYGNLFTESRIMINPVGTSFTESDMIGPFLACQNNDSQLLRPLQFQNVRGFTQPTVNALAYSDYFGGLLAVNTNFSPALSQDMELSLSFSLNDARTWVYTVPISSVTTGNRALVCVKMDPVTNNFAYFWYDAREDPSNNSVRPYGAVVLIQELFAALIGPVPIIPYPPASPEPGPEASLAERNAWKVQRIEQFKKMGKLARATLERDEKGKKSVSVKKKSEEESEEEEEDSDSENEDETSDENSSSNESEEEKVVSRPNPPEQNKKPKGPPRKFHAPLPERTQALVRKWAQTLCHPRKVASRSDLSFTSRKLDLPTQEFSLRGKLAAQPLPAPLAPSRMPDLTTRPMLKPKPKPKAHPFLPD